MKKQITEFMCDNCDKKKVSTEGFPYDEGWVYIYEVNAQTKGKDKESNKRIIIKDKHLCSKKCCYEHLKKQI